MYSQKVSKGGHIDSILEGDESIDLGSIFNLIYLFYFNVEPK